MNNSSIVNPFYSARFQPVETESPVYVKLPRAPKNASPVPHLTSLYHHDSDNRYRDSSHPGNCGGSLIRDLILYFGSSNVFDPMSGSGTCKQVCDDLGVDCWSSDIHDGFDASNPGNFFGDNQLFDAEWFDFIWLHPPYWRMKLYADNPNDLSRATTLDEFLERYAHVIANSAHVLERGGKLAILMGDYVDRGMGFIPLVYHTKRLAFEAGLTSACTDIIRFSHGASSSTKVYRSAIIPALHDICMVFTKCHQGHKLCLQRDKNCGRLGG